MTEIRIDTNRPLSERIDLKPRPGGRIRTLTYDGETIEINGVRISVRLLETLSTPTPEGLWFRITRLADGTADVAQRRLDPPFAMNRGTHVPLTVRDLTDALQDHINAGRGRFPGAMMDKEQPPSGCGVIGAVHNDHDGDVVILY